MNFLLGWGVFSLIFSLIVLGMSIAIMIAILRIPGILKAQITLLREIADSQRAILKNQQDEKTRLN